MLKMRTQIRKHSQGYLSWTLAVQRSAHSQLASAASQLCLHESQPCNLLNTNTCRFVPFRQYHMLCDSTSYVSSVFLNNHVTRFRSHILLLFPFSPVLSHTLVTNYADMCDVTLDKKDHVSEKSYSNGELQDLAYGEQAAKETYCNNRKQSLKSSRIRHNSSTEHEHEHNHEYFKEATQFHGDHDGSHDVYAELYFNLVNEEDMRLKNGLNLPGKEIEQTLDTYSQMNNRLTQLDKKDKQVSEIGLTHMGSNGKEGRVPELKLTHTDTDGKAVMVDVGDKTITQREAQAEGRIYLGSAAARLVKENKMKKGDVLTIAQIAGITSAKQTAQLIPLCHNISLTKVEVACVLNEETDCVDIRALVRTSGVTGVEMEALTAVSVAALTVYDMCKAVTHDMVISDVRLVSKSGGKRHFQR